MSGEDGQQPTASQQIDQTVAQDQLQQVIQAVAPFAGLGMAAGNLGQQVDAAASNAGGRYSFSPEQIDAAIAAFQNIIDKSQAVQQEMANPASAVTVVAPAADGPSTRQSQAVATSLGEVQNHNQMLSEYAQRYLQKLLDAKAQYGDAEAANAGNAQRQM